LAEAAPVREAPSGPASAAPRPGGEGGAGRAGNGAGNGARRRGRPGVVVPLLLLLVVAVAAGAYWFVRIRGVVTTEDAYVDGDRVAVSTTIVGRIARLEADEGDTVRAGQLLMQLDDADLRSREAQAQASLTAAEENVKLAATRERQAREDLDRAQVQFRGHAIPQDALDHARTALTVAQAQRAIADADVGTANAALDVVRTQIDDTRVTAPLGGVVAKRWLLPGDIVQPGQPILTLYDLEHVWITANFEETKLASIPVGVAVDVSVDAYPDRRFQGRVERIGATAASQFSLIPPNNASGNFTKVTQRVPVRISLEREPAGGADPPPVLRPGMSAVVTIRRPER
jgi:membrane fusion protein, multidrug efflux system